MSPEPELVEWSTDAVDASQRFDYYAHALATALVPMRLTAPQPGAFRSVLTFSDLGPIAVMRQHGTPRRCYREPQDPVFDRAFVLVANLTGPWQVSHRGRCALQAGDAMLVDTGIDFDLNMFAPYETVGIKLSERWIRQWLPCPAGLVGRRIAAQGGWGRALSCHLAQLSPRLLIGAPLPRPVLVDHVGALLALAAAEAGLAPPPATAGELSLGHRIRDCIALRFPDAALTAADVAAFLGISVRTLHRSLAARQETFGAMLLAARTEAALRMLQSPLMKRLSIAEIAHRAGFADASHFSRVVRRHAGRSPGQLRTGARTAAEAVQRQDMQP